MRKNNNMAAVRNLSLAFGQRSTNETTELDVYSLVRRWIINLPTSFFFLMARQPLVGLGLLCAVRRSR